MSEPTVIEVPQWQGSGSPTARRLREGARLLADLMPGANRVRPRLLGSPGATAEGVRHADVLAANLAEIRRGLDQAGVPLVAGGDCGVELAPIEAAHRRHGERLAVIWFDAHGDLHSPASSASGFFHGMVLRTLLGGGPECLSPGQPLQPRQVILAGVRALEPAERDFADRHRIRQVSPAELTRPSALAEAIAATGADALYLHIDLDVLDPPAFGSVGVPEPGGLTPRQLIAAVEALAGRFTIAGAGITEFEPARAPDLAALRQLVTAVADAAAGARRDDLQRIEEHAVLAWPAPVTRDAERWVLRHTPGVSRRRSNSALPPPPGSRPGHGLERVEAFYAGRGLPIAVQVTPAERHVELDEFLAARGYQRAAPTLVLTARAGSVLAAAPPRPADVNVVLAHLATPEWLQAFRELDDHADSAAVAEGVISKIALPAAFASAVVNDRIAGIGLVVGGHTGWGGIFSMATHPACRRRGIASAILREGAQWAAEHGAERLYLQVERANESARSLYTRLGFTRSHSYHYRIAAPASPAS